MVLKQLQRPLPPETESADSGIGLGRDAQRRIAVVLGDVFGEPPEVAVRVAGFLDGYLRRAPLRAALGLRAMVWAVTWLPIAFVGVPLPASALAPATRRRYLERWAASKQYTLREGFYLLKAIALLGWGAQEAVRVRLGVGPLAAPPRASGPGAS
ncbi:MAG TPA: hypothetical protein VH044_08440 [Polyangiaceae bacterium]|jgi:hypothetical protein|nr:hypothetical protein [Polyangiaceae bacterium]